MRIRTHVRVANTSRPPTLSMFSRTWLQDKIAPRSWIPKIPHTRSRIRQIPPRSRIRQNSDPRWSDKRVPSTRFVHVLPNMATGQDSLPVAGFGRIRTHVGVINASRPPTLPDSAEFGPTPVVPTSRDENSDPRCRATCLLAPNS